MTDITTTIAIRGAPAAIFDLVTTTRLWPQWHPATTGVGGVTERPFQLGDRIREQAQIGSRIHEGTWTVTEHNRPQRAQLRMGERLAITYTFAPEDDGVRLTRHLAYYPEDFAASVPEPARLAALMTAQSEQALQKLKSIIEQIFEREHQ